MLIDRLPCRVQDSERPTLESKLRAWEVVLLLTLATERILECTDFSRVSGHTIHAALTLALVGLYGWGSRTVRWRRLALVGLLAVQISTLARSFPWSGNHLYLELYLVGLAALFDITREEERASLLCASRWVLVTILFYSGLQKLIHGYYFRGEMLAYCIAFYDGFRAVLGPLLPADELIRLSSYRPGANVGPFRMASPLILILSNGTWLFELLAPIALFIRRLRLPAVIAISAFMLITETMARELIFGALFMNTLLLFLPRATNRRLLPLFALLLAWILAMKLGLVPGFRHT